MKSMHFNLNYEAEKKEKKSVKLVHLFQSILSENIIIIKRIAIKMS